MMLLLIVVVDAAFGVYADTTNYGSLSQPALPVRQL